MELIELNSIPVHVFSLEVIDSRMYMIIRGKEGLVIDPLINEDAKRLLKEKNVKKVTILITHEHFDHISGLNWFRENFQCDVFCSEKCRIGMKDPMINLSRFGEILFLGKTESERKRAGELFEKEYIGYADHIYWNYKELVWENIGIKCYEAPGHSAGGSIYLIDDKIVVTGDSLVNGNKTITRLPGGNKKQYVSITKVLLENLEKSLWVLPGHGEYDRLENLLKYL